MLRQSPKQRTQDGRTVQLAELCEILAGNGHEPLTKRAIENLVSDGMPPAIRGRFDLDACIWWYIARLRTSAKRKETETGEGKTISLDTELTRLTKAKADNEEMTLAERTGRVIHVDVYEADMARWVQTAKMALLNIPGRLAPQMHILAPAEQKALMNAAVKQALINKSKLHIVSELSKSSRKRQRMRP